MESLEHYDADIKRLMAEIKCRGAEALELDALVELHARSLKSAIAVFQARAGGEEAMDAAEADAQPPAPAATKPSGPSTRIGTNYSPGAAGLQSSTLFMGVPEPPTGAVDVSDGPALGPDEGASTFLPLEFFDDGRHAAGGARPKTTTGGRRTAGGARSEQ